MAVDNPTTTDDVQTGRQAVDLPNLPAYECPYDPDGRIYERQEQQGYHGVMFSGEYKWSNVRCTAEAYGDTGVGVGPRIRGQPRRSLYFHTEWMEIEAALGCVAAMPGYNRFDPDVVYESLTELSELRTDVRIVVGRESSPVIYVYSTDGAAVYDVFNSMSKSVDVPENTPDWFDEPEGSVYVGPDELDIFPNPETYPTRGEIKDPVDVSKGTPAICRFWWD